MRISGRTAFLLWLIAAIITYMSINSGLELIEEISSTVPRSRTIDSLQAVIDSLRIAQEDSFVVDAKLYYVHPDSVMLRVRVVPVATEDSELFHIGYRNTDSTWVQRDVYKR